MERRWGEGWRVRGREGKRNRLSERVYISYKELQV